jgi:hypothetical protein
LEYDLDPEWLLEKFEIGVCEATGLPLVFERSIKYSMHPSTPSVDRIDPRRGYTKDNCQVVCAAINYMMGQYPTHLTRVYARAFLNATDGEYDGPCND